MSVEPPRKPFGPSTLAVHGGEARPKPTHSLTTPIVQTATYTWANSQEIKDHFDGKIDRIDYGRYGNPTQRIAEAKLAALEGIKPTHRNKPVELPADPKRVARAIARHVEKARLLVT